MTTDLPQLPKGALDGQTSAELATILRLLEEVTPGQPKRAVMAWLIDELASRHPDIRTALDAWSENLDDPRPMSEVVLDSLPVDVREAMNV